MSADEDKPSVFQKVSSIFEIPIPEKFYTDDMRKLFSRILKTRQKQRHLVTDLQQQNRELEVERETNPLTGLPNQVALTKQLSAVITARSGEYKGIEDVKKRLEEEKDDREKSFLTQELEERFNKLPPYTVAFCDLNHFGQYNDKCGDMSTDGLIQQIALLLGNAIRQHVERGKDYLARSKAEGDEFVILMPDASGENAAKRMEAVGRSIASKQFLIETPDKKHFLATNITMAFGCYQLDSKVRETGAYDKDYFEVLHSARKLMKKKKEIMKATENTIPHIEEITDPAKLHELQNAAEVIQVFPVDIGKIKPGRSMEG